MYTHKRGRLFLNERMNEWIVCMKSVHIRGYAVYRRFSYCSYRVWGMFLSTGKRSSVSIWIQFCVCSSLVMLGRPCLLLPWAMLLILHAITHTKKWREFADAVDISSHTQHNEILKSLKLRSNISLLNSENLRLASCNMKCHIYGTFTPWDQVL